MLTAAAKFVL